MRRVLRILAKGLPHASLVLCVASAALWVRGYWVEDVVRWARPTMRSGQTWFYNLESGGGSVAVTVGNLTGEPARQLAARNLNWRRRDPRMGTILRARAANRWGFANSVSGDPTLPGRRVIFPAWFPVALFAPLPLARVAMTVANAVLRPRHRQGHCPNCGYDLRATPDRCPECGHVPAGSALK